MKYNCDYCNKEINVKPSRLKKQKSICCSIECSSKLRSVYQTGDKNPNYGNKGVDSKLFKGERKITDAGYVKIYEPTHPMSDKSGRVLEHRLVAEKYIAAKNQLIELNGYFVLDPNLDVHHKDFNKENNCKDNLEILTRKEHACLHQGFKHRENSVVKTCLNCGKDYMVIKCRNNTSSFCCTECMNEFRRNNSVENTCPVCNNTFYSSEKQFRRCCSVKCSNIYKNRGLVNFKCDFCGEQSYMKKSRFDKSEKHYCNMECYINSKRK